MTFFNAIPSALTGRPNWMGTIPDSKGDWKHPSSLRSGFNGQWTTEAAYSDFPDAIDALESGKTQQIGFVFRKNCGWFFIDLDKVRDPETGEVAEWAQRVIDQFTGIAYIEISLSGCGFHIIFEGRKADWMKGTTKKVATPDLESKFECFDEKFVVLTGNTIEGSLRNFGDGQEIFEQVYAGFFPQTVSEEGKSYRNEKEIAVSALNGLNAKRADDYSDWLCTGMSLHSVSTDLLSEWEAWSRKSNKFVEGECQRKWESFSGGQGITIGTLVFLAKQDGWTPPRKTFRRTDYGNAERLVHKHGQDVRYCGPSKSWRVWNGKYWDEDQKGVVVQFAKSTVRAMYSEITAIENDQQRQLFAKFIAGSESCKRLEAMVKLARDEVPIVPKEFDSDPLLLNVQNGTVDLRTGELREHRREDLITKICPVEYLPNVTSQLWIDFLDCIFNSDQELIQFLQRWFGYRLTGLVREQLFLVFWGKGNNGKSTLLDLAMWMMGDYADVAPEHLLTERKGGDEHPTEIADLHGRRLVVASESEKHRKLRIQLVKKMTGDTRLKGRFTRKDYFSFNRTFEPILVTNNKPKIQEDSDAVWRRVRLIPFGVTIPQNARDKKFLDKLKVEAPAILNWLVDGCVQWQRHGLGESGSITEATHQYREESDPLQDFILDCCILKSVAWTPTKDLRTAYESYCNEQGGRPVNATDFTDSLRKHSCEPGRKHAGRGWKGVGLLSDSNNEARPEELLK